MCRQSTSTPSARNTAMTMRTGASKRGAGRLHPARDEGVPSETLTYSYNSVGQPYGLTGRAVHPAEVAARLVAGLHRGLVGGHGG